MPSLLWGGVASVSGFSSGADVAVQLAVAYGDLFAGVGVFAGQPYHCAVRLFDDNNNFNININNNKTTHPAGPPEAPVARALEPDVPYCENCPAGTTVEYDHCKRWPDRIIVADLVAAARRAVPPGQQRRRAWLFRGAEDATYAEGTVRATEAVLDGLGFFYTHFVGDVPLGHALPTVDPALCAWQNASTCAFDGARAALEFIYNAPLRPPGLLANNDTAPYLRSFDQRPFRGAALLADDGAVFVPPDCGPCAVHLFLHGCGVGKEGFDVYTAHSGFNNWALANGIVVVYPRMAKAGTYTQQRHQCWDAYGQTGADYDRRAGSQMGALARIAEHFVQVHAAPRGGGDDDADDYASLGHLPPREVEPPSSPIRRRAA